MYFMKGLTDFKKMNYKKPTKKQIKRMAKETPHLNTSCSDISLKKPHNPRDSAGKLDLDSVKSYSHNASRKDIEFANLADENLLDLFLSFSNEHGLSYEKKYLETVMSELGSIILKLKYKFNRSRPWNNGVKVTNISNSAKTPSYPSGHTVQAYVIAGILSRLNPESKSSLVNLADRISLSRMQSGFHYPSDIAAGKKVAKQILKNIKIPNEMFSTKSLTLFDEEMITEASAKESSKLRVLDFDDTIAKTAERVRVETPSGFKMISPEEFAIYDLGKGEYFDPDVAFKEFDKVDVGKASPVPFVSDLFKTFVEASGNRRVLILTARGDEVRDYVMEFLRKKLNIEDPESKVLFKGVANKDPMEKVRVILGHIESNAEIDFVSFFDDSGKNVKAVSALIDALNDSYLDGDIDRKLKGDIRQVVKDEETEEISLKHPEYEAGEADDYRDMVRSFLAGRSVQDEEPEEEIHEAFSNRSIVSDFIKKYQ
jgi:hypothetical protein